MDRQQRENILKYVLAAIVAGAGGYAGLFLIKDMLALAATVVGMVVLFNLTPFLAQALARTKIMALGAPDRANPIPDLWLQFQKQADALAAGANAITAYNQELKIFADKLQTFKTLWPERAVQFQDTHDNMVKTLKMRIAKLRAAQDKLAEFKGVIMEAQEAWEMTRAAIKANKATKNFHGKDPIDGLREKTALEGVPHSLKQFMAELEASLALDHQSMTLAGSSSPPRLDMQSVVSIDVPAAAVKETVHVSTRR